MRESAPPTRIPSFNSTHLRKPGRPAFERRKFQEPAGFLARAALTSFCSREIACGCGESVACASLRRRWQVCETLNDRIHEIDGGMKFGCVDVCAIVGAEPERDVRGI